MAYPLKDACVLRSMCALVFPANVMLLTLGKFFSATATVRA